MNIRDEYEKEMREGFPANDETCTVCGEVLLTDEYLLCDTCYDDYSTWNTMLGFLEDREQSLKKPSAWHFIIVELWGIENTEFPKELYEVLVRATSPYDKLGDEYADVKLYNYIEIMKEEFINYLHVYHI